MEFLLPRHDCGKKVTGGSSRGEWQVGVLVKVVGRSGRQKFWAGSGLVVSWSKGRELMVENKGRN